MPRNGDGSSDNGPIEGHEILHGTTGDDSLQHTKHVAPMPEGEKGDTLPGLSGGGTATQTSTSDSKKRSEPHHASPSPTSHIQQKHSKLDTDEADIAGATSHDSAAHAREQRAKDAVGSEDVSSGAGGHADVEVLHGKATLDGGEQDEKGREADLLQRKKAEKFGGVNLQDDEEVDGGKNSASGSHEESGANGGPVGLADSGIKGKTEESFGTHGSGEMQGKSKEHGHDVGHEADLLQRKKAEKFGGVNLGDDGADASSVGKSKAHDGTDGGSSGDGGAVGHTDTHGHNGDHASAETQVKNKGHVHDVANEADQLQRKKAEKFGGVNLSEDRADASPGLKNSTHDGTDGGPVGGTKGQNKESDAHNAGHADSETHSKDNGHASEGKKKDHGLDLANDADLLQRKKAEKFGGVNLGDD